MENYTVGTYYKRIWRPQSPKNPFPSPPIDKIQFMNSFIPLKMLIEKLEILFESIEPCEDNLSVYGHRIREILLFACTEVESSWTAVFKDNGFQPKGKFFTTEDYFKLKDPMFLDGYELKLQLYPNYPIFSPFDNWNSLETTKSLNWYHAYNKTKHDREKNINFATLENTVSAVGAAVIMFYSQFGPRSEQAEFIRKTFGLITVKLSKYENRYYNPNPPNNWIEKKYEF